MAQEELCRNADIADVLTIIFVNYVVHAVTVLTSPGTSPFATADAALWALLVPYKGITMALRVISKGACFTMDPLEKATRARALCCVYRIGEPPSFMPAAYGAEEQGRCRFFLPSLFRLLRT
jgi:hypothetical protein